MTLHVISRLELVTDLRDSLGDILACQRAMLLGIDRYSGGQVITRLEDNARFVDVITEELHRRETRYDTNR